MKFILNFSVQMTMLIVDLMFNTFSTFIVKNREVLILMFAIQDLILILSIVTISITFFRTSVFQAGFVDILWKKFWPIVIISPSYLLLSITLHGWILFLRWTSSAPSHEWPWQYHLCFILHRLMCPAHYHIYKRTLLTITDEQLYEKEWIAERIRRRN